jgi:hypothetical protein
MKMKTKVCAVAIALLAGTACFAVQADARNLATPASQLRARANQSKNLYMSASAVYDAGVRRGSARSSSDAYLRGFRDGTGTAAYTSRQYIVNSAPVYSGTPVYSAAPAYGYSYSRDTAYTPALAGYSYSGRTIALGDSSGYNNGYYDNGYGYSQYNAGYVSRGLTDVAITPVVMAQPLEAQSARLNYCAARYQSFDSASGTFLADDGYRHYCR